MAINSVSNDSTYRAGMYKTATQTAQEAQKTEEKKTEEKATTSTKEDTFEKSATYKADMETINSMKADLKNNVSAFKSMVQGLFVNQGSLSGNAMNILLNIDKATQASAQEAISEDGEWGVGAVSSRILDFAKALSGGDPSKIDLLKNAVDKGFSAAEKIWGGKMPEITQQTYDKVMEGFDEWAKAGATTTEDK